MDVSTADVEHDITDELVSAKGSTQKNNPMSGCVLFIILFSVFLFVIGWFAYKYFDLKKTTWAISEETSIEFPEVTYSDQQAKLLEQKFKTFSNQVKAAEGVSTVSFTKDEINQAIQQFERMEPIRGQLYVTDLKDGHIYCKMSLSVKKSISGGNRYVNGTLKIKPSIEQGSLFPRIVEIHSNRGQDKTSELAYMQHMSGEIGNDFREDETMQAVFHHLSEVSVSDGVLTVSANPTSRPVAKSDKEVSKSLNKGLGIVFLLCFMFGTTIMFLLWLQKRNAKLKEQE